MEDIKATLVKLDKLLLDSKEFTQEEREFIMETLNSTVLIENDNKLDFYKYIKEQGFNGRVAMDIGCTLALAWLEKSEEEAMAINNNAVDEIERYCRDHNISNKLKRNFLIEVNEYSLK